MKQERQAENKRNPHPLESNRVLPKEMQEDEISYIYALARTYGKASNVDNTDNVCAKD